MFGANSGGELLMGGGSQSMNRSASGSGSGGSTPAQTAAGAVVSGGASSFDLSSDFPTLGGGGGGGGIGGGAGAGVGVGAGVGGVGGLSGPSSGSATPSGFGAAGDGLAAALRQQQLLQQQQQQQQASNLYRLATAGQASINIAAEDFPALGAPTPSGGVVGGGGQPQAAAAQVQRSNSGSSNPPSANSSPYIGPSTNSNNSKGKANKDDAIGRGGGGAGGGNNANSNPLLNGLVGGIASLNLGSSSDNTSGGNGDGSKADEGGGGGNDKSSAAPGAAISGSFGLMGLLKIIRMTDADRKGLALGADLSTLGLDMTSGDRLSDKFGGPFTEDPSSEPRFHLPTCYFVNPPALKTGHLSKFTLEILFYIFYGMPKDALQAYAAQELHNREWRYHVEHQLWFKRAVPGDGIDLGDGSPKYIYFDYRSWDRRHFTGSIQDLAQGFLAEDDVRVRLGNSS
mmetsp:Transcript_18943/g.54586  ORF Transcript_18943/g.54586 Transcript_18943/m.54586 type:complete len:456 (+) Transcript_18943:244-1611(+)|eukprot:CAMPEP_0181056900 /NCGR_PEP_ID=MMETSP1070-20121207/19961_1 /TAXON_ID=265543 /ORGANISM="Minutocellus polymorphus, Strain NH13" /LENGTH=455 /DNA_ID=CAMNT_0023136273 /DNA_START=169 /DNA_END=1536 /DNA_ORIENTATION=-